MPDDETKPIWDRLDRHQRAIEDLRTRDARKESRLDAVEKRTDLLMQEVNQLRGESQERHNEVRAHMDGIKEKVDQGVGAVRLAVIILGGLFSLLSIGATVAGVIY